uniref:Protein NipSnap (inferred by orthology to a D. melanogaster protein) n=1 Tax=Strongyloides venezuelensis TaxID=75913 RepID=A0A0K0FFD3_STRVS
MSLSVSRLNILYPKLVGINGLLSNSRFYSSGDKISSPSGGQGFLSKILHGQTVDHDGIGQQSHSSLLSDNKKIYEIVFHRTKCGEMDKYMEAYKNYVHVSEKINSNVELLGSWNIIYGDQDQAVHLWRYNEGFEDVDELIKANVSNIDFKNASNEVGKLCSRRKAILTKAFSYWGDPTPREGNHVYDMRRYILKPGTVLEWGNAWAKGITHRRDFNQDVGGFFAQVGQLYIVYHFWAYKGMSGRNDIRKKTWSKPGWDQTVSYTVPLLKEMKSQIMVPTELSKLK